MLTLRMIITFTLVALFIAGCSPFETHSVYDHSIDFSRLKTYGWGKCISKLSDKEDTLVRDTIDQQLALRRCHESSAVGGPAFLIRYTLSVEDKVRPQKVDMGPRDDLPDEFTSKPNYAGQVWGRKWMVVYYSWKQATLVIDISDPNKDGIIWQGSAGFELNEDLTQKEREKRLRDAVVEIFRKYPIKIESKTKPKETTSKNDTAQNSSEKINKE
ncbi:DUF4136 domain-containing protein [Candidatus Auribacterota bacterium]